MQAHTRWLLHGSIEGILVACCLAHPQVVCSQSVRLNDEKTTSVAYTVKHGAAAATGIPGGWATRAGRGTVSGGLKALSRARNVITQGSAAILPSMRAANQPLMPGQERTNISFDKSDEPIIMLAVSGGGSRAAYYTASVFEQLSKMPDPLSPQRTLMDRVHVISSVSGGSLAAAYYTVNFEKRYETGFYSKFKDAMARNLEGRMYAETFLWPPATASVLLTDKTRTDVLADFVENVLGKRKTFDDLQHQYVNAPTGNKPPLLLINGTMWNTGSRVVMTNLPPSRFPIPLPDKTLYQDGEMPSAYRRSVGILRPVHFEAFGSNIGSFSLAKAVTASMAYPIFLAPYNLKVYPQNIPPSQAGVLPQRVQESPWIQVADGGVYANDSTDSLFSLLKTIPQNKPVLLLYIQGGFGLESLSSERGRTWGLNAVINRMYDISNSRPMGLYLSNSQQLHNPDKVMMLPLTLGGYSDKQAKRLFSIPTALRLSWCNRCELDRVVPENTHDIAPAVQDALLVLSGKKGKKAGLSSVRKTMLDAERRRVQPDI